MNDAAHYMNFNRKRPTIFYGWYIVGACFLISLYIAGIVNFGFTAIIEPLANEFGWSYTQISFAASLRGIESGLAGPLVGMLVDRWGPKRLLFAGIIIAGFGLLLLSRTTSLAIFYGAFILISVGMSACSSPVTMTAIANWFRKRFSLAAGVMSSGVGFGGLLVPLVVLLIKQYEWRMTMVIVGLGMWVIALPLSLLVRHKPEQYGYLPDGESLDTTDTGEGTISVPIVDTDINTRQALTSRTFLHLAFSFMCGGLIIGALSTHVMPYLGSIGISREVAGIAASGIPLASIVGRLGFGWLGDRMDAKRVAALGFVMYGSGLLFFSYISLGGYWFLVPALILLGIGYGANAIMIQTLILRFFSRSRFGTIIGFMVGAIMVGHVTGAPLAGWVYDVWGSYQSIWLAYAGLTIVSIVVLVTTPAYIKARS